MSKPGRIAESQRRAEVYSQTMLVVEQAAKDVLSGRLPDGVTREHVEEVVAMLRAIFGRLATDRAIETIYQGMIVRPPVHLYPHLPN